MLTTLIWSQSQNVALYELLWRKLFQPKPVQSSSQAHVSLEEGRVYLSADSDKYLQKLISPQKYVPSPLITLCSFIYLFKFISTAGIQNRKKKQLTSRQGPTHARHVNYGYIRMITYNGCFGERSHHSSHFENFCLATPLFYGVSGFSVP